MLNINPNKKAFFLENAAKFLKKNGPKFDKSLFLGKEGINTLTRTGKKLVLRKSFEKKLEIVK